MDYLLQFTTQIILYILIASSYNLVLGYAGQFHIAHVAFLAIGAYSYSLLSAEILPYPFLATLLAGIITIIPGYILGKLTLRLKSHYLVIASFGCAEIVRLTALNWVDLTNGSRGLFGIKRILGLDGNLEFLILTTAFCVAGFYIMNRIVNSQYGLLLEAVREDDLAVESLGRDTGRIKLEIFCISAFFAGIGGALFAQYLRVLTPDAFKLTDSIFILLIVLLGGKGSLKGTIFGAILLMLFFEIFRFIPLVSSQVASIRIILYALCYVLIMLYRPEGIFKRKVFQKSFKK